MYPSQQGIRSSSYPLLFTRGSYHGRLPRSSARLHRHAGTRGMCRRHFERSGRAALSKQAASPQVVSTSTTAQGVPFGGLTVNTNTLISCLPFATAQTLRASTRSESDLTTGFYINYAAVYAPVKSAISSEVGSVLPFVLGGTLVSAN